MPRGATFLQLLLAFIGGGLFFSTFLTFAAAVLAIGEDNAKRLLLVLRKVVERVWRVCVAMVRAWWTALFARGTTTRWVDASKALKEGFVQARQAAAEGVEAIRLETSLYAGAVGAPGLLPLQYVLDRLTPRTLVPIMASALEEALDGVVNSNVRKLRLRKLSAGTTPPHLMAARLYDLGPETLAFDVDVQWRSSLSAELEVTTTLGARVPVTLRNVRFEGPVRLLATNLTSSAPGYGAILISLPSPPSIGLDVRVAGGELTKLPWLRSEVERAIQKAVAEELLWPRRLVVPAPQPAPQQAQRRAGTSASGKAAAFGSWGGAAARPPAKPPSFLSADELAALAVDDPLLRAERALASQPALRELREPPTFMSRTRSLLRVINVSSSDRTPTPTPTPTPTDGEVAATPPPPKPLWSRLLSLRGGHSTSELQPPRPLQPPQPPQPLQLPRWVKPPFSLTPPLWMRGLSAPPPSPSPSPSPPSPLSTRERAVLYAYMAMRLGIGATRTAVVTPLLALLAFKPPVGALIAVQCYRRLRRRSILEDAARFFPTSWSASRSLDLDSGDREYALEGGVHFVRVELYRTLLGSRARGWEGGVQGLEGRAMGRAPGWESGSGSAAVGGAPGAEAVGGGFEAESGSLPAAAASGSDAAGKSTGGAASGGEGHSLGSPLPPALSAEEAHVEELARSLALSCGPGSSREGFVRSSSEHLDRLRVLRAAASTSSAPRPLLAASPRARAAAGRVRLLSAPVEALVELRAADSLLRLLRDKLLLSAKILEQGVAESHAHVRRISLLGGPIFSRAKRTARGEAAVMAERKQLKVMSALLERQLERLGAVQQLLLARPTPLSPSALVDPIAAYRQLRSSPREPAAEGVASAVGGSAKDDVASKGDRDSGSGVEADDTDAEIDVAFCTAARAWTRSVRATILDTCSEIVHSVARELGERDNGDGEPALGAETEPLAQPVAEMQAQLERLQAWADDSGSDGWLAALSLVDGLPKAQRAERTLLPGMYSHVLRSIPGSVISAAFGLGVHHAMVPRWPAVVSASRAARTVALGMWEKRFLTPVREIVLDLLNRQPRLADAAALEDSQASLDSMLADFAQEQSKRLPVSKRIGGGGKGIGRAAELEAVSKAYEAEIKRGTVKTLLTGQLVRLILIQVQLLKVCHRRECRANVGMSAVDGAYAPWLL